MSEIGIKLQGGKKKGSILGLAMTWAGAIAVTAIPIISVVKGTPIEPVQSWYLIGGVAAYTVGKFV